MVRALLILDPTEKFNASRTAFHGHSRLSEPTRIDPTPMTY